MEQQENWVTPGDDEDFVAWAVRSLFRATRERVGVGDWELRGDDAALEQQLVDCQWELALQHELVDGNRALTRSLLRRGAAPSPDMEPVVAYVRSAAGRGFVREQFLGCLALLAREAADTLAQTDAEPDDDGVIPTFAERVAGALNARLARHAEGLRQVLELTQTDTGELISDATVYQLLERA